MKIWKIIKMACREDTLILGVISGLVGTLTMDIANLIFYKIHASEALWGHFAGSIFIPPRQTKKPQNFLLGQIEHLITGGLLGIPLAYILKITKKYPIIKGWGYGLATWGLLYNIFAKAKLYSIKHHTSISYYSTLIQNSIFGIVAALSIVSLGGEKFNQINQKPNVQMNSLANSTSILATDAVTDKNDELLM